MTYKIDTPDLEPASPGLLSVIEVIDGTGHQLFEETKFELPLDGHNLDVPVSAGPLAAPALTKGATATTGGTLATGTYYWRLTAVTGYGETTGSNEVSATFDALVTTGSQVLGWAAVDGAELYRLYRGTAAGAQDTLVATVGADTLSYTDTGAAGTPGTVPAASTAGDAPAAEKVFDQLDAPISTALFQQYRGIESPVLLGEDSAQLIKDAFDRGETYAVERKIQQLVLNPVAVDITPTPGTPVTNHKLAIGLLEQYARDNSTFKPYITGNALGITVVQDFIPKLETIFGTTVTLAGGYGATGPGGRVAAAGQAWLYVHGKIILWRGPSDAEAVARDLKANRQYALAEGSYAAAVTNFAAAILVGI